MRDLPAIRLCTLCPDQGVDCSCSMASSAVMGRAVFTGTACKPWCLQWMLYLSESHVRLPLEIPRVLGSGSSKTHKNHPLLCLLCVPRGCASQRRLCPRLTHACHTLSWRGEGSVEQRVHQHQQTRLISGSHCQNRPPQRSEHVLCQQQIKSGPPIEMWQVVILTQLGFSWIWSACCT
jgi:hypothetical protein